MVEGGGVCLHVSCDIDNEFWSGGRWRGLSTCMPVDNEFWSGGRWRGLSTCIL